MTSVEILFRYDKHPTESAVFALNNLSEVYGIRRIQLKEDAKTIRVEYDATRLNGAIVCQLLRRAGIDVVEEMPLIPPQAEKEPASARTK